MSVNSHIGATLLIVNRMLKKDHQKTVLPNELVFLYLFKISISPEMFPCFIISVIIELVISVL